MSRSTHVRAVGAFLLLLAGAAPLRAQSAQRVSIQLSGLSVGTYGDAYEGLEPGAGVEAQLRITPGAWSFGIGGQRSSHATTTPGFTDQQVVLQGVFIEPRRVIDIGSSRVAPYLSARGAWLQQSIDFTLTNGVEFVDVTANASGAQLNAGGGLLLRLSPRVNLDLGATVGVIRFGDVLVDVPGLGRTTVSGSSGTGQNVVLRVGVAIGLGG